MTISRPQNNIEQLRIAHLPSNSTAKGLTIIWYNCTFLLSLKSLLEKTINIILNKKEAMHNGVIQPNADKHSCTQVRQKNKKT